jgi:cobalt-zinc-cadmium efflux system outer membrane protein
MNDHRPIWPIVTIVASLAGCAAHPLHDQGWVIPRPVAARFDAYRSPTDPPDESASFPVFNEPTGVVTLRDVLSAALLNNPQLESFSWEVRVREARTLQARLWPNPEAGVGVENIAGSGAFSGVDSAETTVLLSQRIPLGGKIRKQTRVAEIERDLAGWDYEAARIVVVTEVVRALVQVDAAQRRVELAMKNLELAEQVYDVAAKRVKAGAAVLLERTRAGVVVETSRIALQRAERGLMSVRHRLAATWGSTTPAFEKVTANLDAIAAVPPLEVLEDHVTANPDLARWTVQVSQCQAAVELARAQAVPDLTAGVGARRFEESDDTAAVVEFSLPLPLFDRNQGGVLESRFALAKARADRRAAEVRVSVALATTYQELAAAHAEAQSLRDDVLPAAQEAFDATNQSYQQGKRGYLEVLDAQRSLFEARGQYINALADYHSAVAEVEGLIGQGLDEFRAKQNHDKDGNETKGHTE